MKLSTTHIIALLLVSVVIMSCRGQQTDKPPIRHHFNMTSQDRFNAQQENPFFEDGMAMRTPVEGTIARGNLRHDMAFYEGRDEDGNYIDEIPVELTESFLYRGKERYDIFCTACHGGIGDGNGVIMVGGYGYVPAPSFHTDQSRNMPNGEMYSAIAEGIRTMPSYASQIKVEDRWAIVAYIRALQRSQNIPEEQMEQFDLDLAELQEIYRTEQERAAALAEARARTAVEEVSVEAGEQSFIRNGCQACHSLDGTQVLGPTFQGLYQSEVTLDDGSTVIADEEYLIESIVDPSAKIVAGFDNVMPPYDFLSENEVQSLVEFIKSHSDEQ